MFGSCETTIASLAGSSIQFDYLWLYYIHLTQQWQVFKASQCHCTQVKKQKGLISGAQLEEQNASWTFISIF